jgi:dTDP-4-amino-4,6-dideoxygalactose transaminase
MGQLTSLAQRHALAVVEDAAQAVGARLCGQPVGTFGHAACFSFYPTKNMHSIEGGMIVTPDPAIRDRLRLLRDQGMRQRYRYEVVGLNARMTDVAAAVGRVQLRAVSQWVAARRANAAHLDAHLHGVRIPTVAFGAEHAYHQYTVRVTGDRDTLARRAARHGITTAVYYPNPVHRTPAYQQTLDLPHTERATKQVLSLPVHPGLTPGELTRIIAAVNP